MLLFLKGKNDSKLWNWPYISTSVLDPKHLGARNMSSKLKEKSELIEEMEKKKVYEIPGKDLEIIQLV